MDKESFLENYIEIETKTFIRKEKNKKFNELFHNIKTLKTTFSFIDIFNIINQLTEKRIIIRQPLFFHIIHPILSDQINEDNVEAIKTLIKLEKHLSVYQHYTKDNTFSLWDLLHKGLRLSPDDKDILELYEKKASDFFVYTLHEIPAGVLYGANGATIEECMELITELEVYEIVCKKLHLDRNELIKDCKYYYPAYKEYLSVYKNYKSFRNYLAEIRIKGL